MSPGKKMSKRKHSVWIELSTLIFWTVLLAFFFANVEVQIEGGAGWASNLPTWKVEKHWLLDIFWGGRPMTGYHAWIFSFMFLVFHLGIFQIGKWSWSIECRIIASLMIFWIVEDFLWFVINPAYGLQNFSPQKVPWHINWFLGIPVDYWTFTGIAVLFFFFSFRKRKLNE